MPEFEGGASSTYTNSMKRTFARISKDSINMREECFSDIEAILAKHTDGTKPDDVSVTFTMLSEYKKTHNARFSYSYFSLLFICIIIWSTR